MDTIARGMELADERNLSLFKLSQLCDVSYSTLKNAEMRGSQLGVPTIDKKNRWRSVTVAFRVSPEEAYRLNMVAKTSGLTKDKVK